MVPNWTSVKNLTSGTENEVNLPAILLKIVYTSEIDIAPELLGSEVWKSNATGASIPNTKRFTFWTSAVVTTLPNVKVSPLTSTLQVQKVVSTIGENPNLPNKSVVSTSTNVHVPPVFGCFQNPTNKFLVNDPVTFLNVPEKEMLGLVNIPPALNLVNTVSLPALVDAITGYVALNANGCIEVKYWNVLGEECLKFTLINSPDG